MTLFYTLIFDIFLNLRRWPLPIADICFNSFRQWKILPKIIASRFAETWFREVLSNTHRLEVESFVDLFTRTLDRGSLWQDRLLPFQPFPLLESGQSHLIHSHPQMTDWLRNDKNGSLLCHSEGNVPGWEEFHPCHPGVIPPFGDHSGLEWPSNVGNVSLESFL